MTCGKWLFAVAVGAGSLAWVAGTISAQAPDSRQAGRTSRDQLQQPVFRVAQQVPEGPRVAANANNLPAQPGAPVAQAPGHPLDPALQMAYGALITIRNNVKDYSAVMTKRERIGGKLNDPEYMFVKIRHEPFSVYMYFLGPNRLKGQEALYVVGQNNGNLLGHGVGVRKIAGTVPLQPTGAMAMAGQRYPITEIGFYNLTKRLVEVAEQDKKIGMCEVKFYKGAKINGRLATCIEVVHPAPPNPNYKFNKALVFVDDELNIPVRYQSFDWPERAGGPPLLLEEYTYTDVKLNQGFTDQDFNEHNPSYHFH